MNFKEKTKKTVALLLVTTTFSGISPTTYATDTTPKSEKIKKVLKYASIPLGTIAAAGTAIGIYKLGNKALDKMDPNRKIIRNNIKKAKSEIPDLRRQLLEENDYQAKNELRQMINDRIQIITENGGKTPGLLEKVPILNKVPLVGGAVAVGGLALGTLDVAGGAAKKIMNISYMKYAVHNFKDAADYIKQNLETPPSELSKDEVFKKFDTVFDGIEGQDDAIREVKNHLYDIVVAKNQAKWKNEKYSHGDVLYFHGLSGVGKSSVSSRIAEALYTNPKVYTVTTSDVDKDSKDSIVSQLFGTKAPTNVNPYYPPVEKTKDLSNFLKSNPNGIVRIEEYDKICTPSLDEVIRTISECGVVNIDGQKVDCSGILFILTSNEDKVSMEGFDKNDSTALDKESIAQGYTRVWHDKSFLNRVRKVEFKNLSLDTYETIFKNHFDELAKYWIDSKNAGIKLTIDNETIETLAKEVERLNQGARSIDLNILPMLQGEIGNKIKSAPNLDFYRDKTLSVTYDEKNRKFMLTEV